MPNASVARRNRDRELADGGHGHLKITGPRIGLEATGLAAGIERSARYRMLARRRPSSGSSWSGVPTWFDKLGTLGEWVEA